MFKLFKDVKELKDLLNDLGYEETVVFENPSYLKAIIGISDDGALCYSYEKMVQCLMEEDKWNKKKLWSLLITIQLGHYHTLPRWV